MEKALQQIVAFLKALTLRQQVVLVGSLLLWGANRWGVRIGSVI